MPDTMNFPAFTPDTNDLGDNQFPDVVNAVARINGYGPFKDLTSFTQALPSSCRGYFFARNGDGSISVFAATATDLWLLNNTTFAWVNVSKATYTSVSADSNWQFAQFNNFVIAVQANTPPQKFVLGSSSAFADLGGSPPNAGGIAIVGFFVVLTQLLSNSTRVIWSDLDAPETWTAGVGLSDFQDLPDGGSAIGISGGDAYGILFQQQSIRTMTYAPGSPVVFQINRISTQEALFAKYSIVNIGERTFYCGAAGFKMVVNGGIPVPIGKEQVDRFFFGDVDQSNLQLVIGASDPTATRVYFAYKSQSGHAGLFDKVLVYDWAIQARPWSLLVVSGEWLASLAKPGLTLEQLDALAPGALTVTGAASNGSGLIRLTLNQISNAFFSIAGQNFIIVQGVVGTTEANGRWVVNIIDSTHIDLIGSAFVHAYVSGGAIGGSLDALPFSLDSITKAATAQLSAFGSLNQLGFFDGPNLEAQLNTEEVDGQGTMLFTSGLRPITDCAAAMCSVGYRLNKQATLQYTDEMPIDETGWAPVLIESRYQRAKMRAPYGSSWTYSLGIAPDGQGAGDN